MNLCKLCLRNEATQTGSHVVSAFYVKPVIGGRGKEESYSVTNNPFQDYKEDRKDQFVKEDFILCTPCEKRLSYVESYISTEFSNKFRQPNFSQNFVKTRIRARNGLVLIEPSRVNTFAYQIFIYSIVWRASISTSEISDGFSLTPEVEEGLRRVLDNCIPPSEGYRGVTVGIREWFKTLADEHEASFWYPFLVITPQSEQPFGSGFISFIQGITTPYNIIIGDSIIYFNCHTNSTNDQLGFLRRHNREAFYNQGSNKVRVLMVSDDVWAQKRKKLIKWVSNQRAHSFYKGVEATLIKDLGELPRNYKDIARAAYSLHVQQNGL